MAITETVWKDVPAGVMYVWDTGETWDSAAVWDGTFTVWYDLEDD
ncbi:MAG TPA: hypothetical protein VNA25_19935 [Phycisphaerae bacterium]|nr:hypothetical protein [Phycisphaerae bacterium]